VKTKITADQIFKRANRAQPVIQVEAWGVDLRVRKISFERMMEISANAQNINGAEVTFDKDKVVDTIIQCTWCIDSDEPFFEERHKEQLLEEDFDVVLYVFREIMKLNGNKEDAEKN
jgi:hypothetical protein